MVMVSSCSLRKIVPPGKALLVQNNVEGGEEAASATKLLAQVKHDPNRRGILQKYRFRRYLETKDLPEEQQKGVKPIFLDSNLVELSAENMKNYLFNSGYYDASVTYKVRFKGKLNRKAEVTYVVSPGEPYRISFISYKSNQRDVEYLVKQAVDIKDRDLKPGEVTVRAGQIINHDDLGEVRNRVTQYLKNRGFYAFNRSYIEFQLDSNQKEHTVHLAIKINPPENKYHRIYTIGSIDVKILHEHELSGRVSMDSAKGIRYEIGNYKMKQNPEVISSNIGIKRNQEYEQAQVDWTYSRLINLDLFRIVDIKFYPINDSSTVLATEIRLIPNPKYDLIWEPQIITSDQRVSEQSSTRSYGIANELTFKNRNIFYNGEEFDLRSRTSMETQLSKDSVRVVSTFSQEVNAELRFPRLVGFDNDNILPELKSLIPKTKKSQTRMNLAYVYENNPFYRRNVFPLTMTYDFIYDDVALYWTAGLISLNQSEVSPQFQSGFSDRFSSYLDRLFTNNLITSTRLIVAYSNEKSVPGNYWTIHSNALELAGIALPILTNGGELFRVQHSSFVRTDIDARFHKVYNKHTSWVLRGFAGIGVPFRGTILPYSRRYYVGGANSLRGWRPRTVGPGSYTSTSSVQIDRSGEVLLQGNAEYRFDIYTGPFDLELALFGDIGNVWTINETTYEGGAFNPKTFASQIAMNTGVGIRFDFTYFLFRLDYGIPVKDPNLVEGERWVIRDFFRNKGNIDRNIWNLAIGYPF